MASTGIWFEMNLQQRVRRAIYVGRVFKTVAFGEAAYAAILVAEEVLDVMQRDWMRDERSCRSSAPSTTSRWSRSHGT